MLNLFTLLRWVSRADMISKILRLVMMMYSGMHNIMEADIEQISQLMQFADALLEYHKQCSEILQVRFINFERALKSKLL